MIIYDLHIVIVIVLGRETDPVLIVDPDAVLSLAVSLERLQMIRGRDTQILQTSCIVDHDQFSQRYALNILRQLLGKDLMIYL